jgi:hypothetical protein
MKRTAVCLVFLAVVASLFAQTQAGEPEPSRVGVDSAQQLLKEVSVTRFEDASYFYASMPVDQGLVTLRRFAGGAAEKVPIQDEVDLGIPQTDENVLGVRVDFFRRGAHTLVIAPVKPIPIEGTTKMLSLWVVGRNYNHVLKILVSDYFGDMKELTVGRLNFLGWKKLSVAVPPTIRQDEFHYSGTSGLEFRGLKIDFDLAESYGSYYVYFDDLRAWTDLFAEVSRDTDTMTDDW